MKITKSATVSFYLLALDGFSLTHQKANALISQSHLTPSKYSLIIHSNNYINTLQRRHRSLHRLHFQNDSSSNGTLRHRSTDNTEGVLEFLTEEDLINYHQSHPSTILILKFYDPYCRACKRISPLFKKLSLSYRSHPNIQFAEIDTHSNPSLIKRHNIVGLPTISIFAGSDGLLHSMECGRSKINILRDKLNDIIHERMDSVTKELTLTKDRPMSRVPASVEDGALTDDDLFFLHEEIEYFRDMSDFEFLDVVDKATIDTYEEDSVIVREGLPGQAFYVIQEGEVELRTTAEAESVNNKEFGGATTTTSNGGYDFLGNVVNVMKEGDFFGERALMTGEPFAETVRALRKTKCFVFSKENFPETSLLGKRRKRIDHHALLE